MKPVMQTKTDLSQPGDCYRACIASVLELPIEDVPDFRQLQEQHGCCMVMESDKWLREHHGKRFISIELYSDREGSRGRHLTDQVIFNRLAHANEGEFVLLSGVSPRQNADGSVRHHCVVAIAEHWGFEVVHDPHPAGGGIVGQPWGVKWIVPV